LVTLFILSAINCYHHHCYYWYCYHY